MTWGINLELHHNNFTIQSYFPVGDEEKQGPAGLTLTSGNNRKVKPCSCVSQLLADRLIAYF